MENLNEKLELVNKLFNRRDRVNEGRTSLERLYPEADNELILTAAHHLFTDGPDALLSMLAKIELLLQNKDVNVYGEQSEVLYHIYNWSIVANLLRISKAEIYGEFIELETLIKNEDNKDAILSQLERVKDLLEGSCSPPSIDN